MYILTVGRSFPEKKTGMIGIFEFEQAVALAKAGNKVVYAFSDDRSVKVIHSLSKIRRTEQGVEVYGRQLPIGGLPHQVFDPIRTAEVKKLIREIIDEQGMPDVIHVHFPVLTLNEALLEFIGTLGCKLVCTEHWTKIQSKQISAWRVERLKSCTEHANAFLCVSGLLRDSVIELTHTEKPVEVVPNMVQAPFGFAPAPEKDDPDSFTFAAVGRLVPVKRFPLVVEAFAEAFRGQENIRLKIAGDGTQRKEIEALIDKCGVQAQTDMLGFCKRPEVAKLYAESDCYVSASILETFGVPFIEAWITGIPCIGARGGPVDCYFKPENGLLFEKEQVKSLAAAMQQVYQNRAQYDRKQISDEAAALFSAEEVVRRLCSIYEAC